MIVSINQPAYLPWLGYFERIAVSDQHIILDHVQFEKNSMVNRNKIRTATGATWLTVPVRTSGRFGSNPIVEVEIADPHWRSKHLKSLQTHYGRARYLPQHLPFFQDLYGAEWTCLAELLRRSTAYLLQSFEIETPLLYSSEMNPSGSKSELILNLCRQAGATTYLSGKLGRSYLDESAFQACGIKVVYQEYQHPTYEQIHRGFEPYMSAIDLLLNCGPNSREILLSNSSLCALR